MRKDADELLNWNGACLVLRGHVKNCSIHHLTMSMSIRVPNKNMIVRRVYAVGSNSVNLVTILLR